MVVVVVCSRPRRRQRAPCKTRLRMERAFFFSHVRLFVRSRSLCEHMKWRLFNTHRHAHRRRVRWVLRGGAPGPVHRLPRCAARHSPQLPTRPRRVLASPARPCVSVPIHASCGAGGETALYTCPQVGGMSSPPIRQSRKCELRGQITPARLICCDLCFQVSTDDNSARSKNRADRPLPTPASGLFAATTPWVTRGDFEPQVTHPQPRFSPTSPSPRSPVLRSPLRSLSSFLFFFFLLLDGGS